MKSGVLTRVALACCVMLIPALEARTWTNAEGKTIEAEFISSNGTDVVLGMDGREVSYPLSKLSQEDRDWVKEQLAPAEEEPMEETPEPTPEPVEPPVPSKPAGPTGYRVGLTIDHPLHDETAAYFAEGAAAKFVEALKAGALAEENPGQPDSWIERPAGQASYRIYVPAGYDGSTPFGLYLHLPNADEGEIPEELRPLLDKHQLIGVSVDGAGDDQPMLRRAMLAADALNTVAQTYEIDPEKRFIAGSGEAGDMAMVATALLPDHFNKVMTIGSVRELPLVGRDGGGFPGMAKRDFLKAPLAYAKWVLLVPKDDEELAAKTATAEEWRDEGLQFHVIQTPGSEASAFDLANGIEWLLEP